MSKSPFLFPAHFYKNLFASAMLQKSTTAAGDKLHDFPVYGQTHFPRNLLFSSSCPSTPYGETNGIDDDKKLSPDDENEEDVKIVVSQEVWVECFFRI